MILDTIYSLKTTIFSSSALTKLWAHKYYYLTNIHIWVSNWHFKANISKWDSKFSLNNLHPFMFVVGKEIISSFVEVPFKMFGFCKSFNRHCIIDTELKAEDIKRDEIERPPSRSSIQNKNRAKCPGFDMCLNFDIWL